MSQHFLLSAAAKTLSLAEVARLTEEEARARFRAVRFAENGGKPFCPKCGSLGVYEYETRKIFKCKGCESQFSLTTGTLFASHKMAMRDILLAIAIFINGVSGNAALRLSRDLGCTYKTAFVLAHKLREAMGTMKTKEKLKGTVEIDGIMFTGNLKKANYARDRKDGRRNMPTARTVVNMRERGRNGRTLSFVYKHESEAIDAVLKHVDRSAKIRTDEGSHWIVLNAHYRDVKTVNHKIAYSIKGVHINQVESLHSRMRHAERGVHHHIRGKHLQSYADELGWREDFRRVDNGKQFEMTMRAASVAPVSKEWKGYWQRGKSNRKNHQPG